MVVTMTTKELIEVLRSKATDTNFEHRGGICDFLRRNLSAVDFKIQIAKFRKACETWPKYSGNPFYPVPFDHDKILYSIDGDKESDLRYEYNEALREAYDVANRYNCLWEPTGEYGRNRRELALWYADYLTEDELNNEEYQNEYQSRSNQ
jgi:hypothetical protein